LPSERTNGGWIMALMVGELYEALKLAQVPDDKARAAATAVADFERRTGKIETLVSVNSAVLAMNTALVIAVAGRLFQFF
jgi:hypothetical protein